MGPGERQPGGESSSNPYQQPGYQQPNPYQASVPGPATLGGAPGGAPPRRKRFALVAVAAVVVLAALGVVGVVVAGGDDDSGGDAGPTASPSAEESPTRSAAPDDPRQGIAEIPDPVVAADWQVQAHEDMRTAYDVPPQDWEVQAPADAFYYEEETADGESTGTPLLGVQGGSLYLDDWCTEDPDGWSWRAVAGTRGNHARGYTGTEDSAREEAGAFALAAYDQQEQGQLEVSEAAPFDNEHGISGHTATATISGVPEDPDDPCQPSSGKVVTVSYLDSENDLVTWVVVADTGFPEELDDETIEQMMSSLRPFPAEEAE
ncbi:hypothetical protein [Streptomyces litchfieldiae]|uniref:DUF8017 domain-containing protein n=1 Tax=Streptomyces litchfieldiae TaxID=3075543 RepID=A0ABU2MP94_9ACTN|nr:hypothetical protein [Streptomyces sp. DSM 44938]MDT0342899.1 hypothetical protein [Streptomyces sp. DSM 44938]